MHSTQTITSFISQYTVRRRWRPLQDTSIMQSWIQKTRARARGKKVMRIYKRLKDDIRVCVTVMYFNTVDNLTCCTTIDLELKLDHSIETMLSHLLGAFKDLERRPHGV